MPDPNPSASYLEAECNRFKPLLADQVETGAFLEARETVATLLRLKPGDRDLLDVQAFIESQIALTGKVGERRCFRGHGDFVNTVALSPDGLWGVSGSGGDLLGLDGMGEGDDRSIRVWELGRAREVCCLKGHSTLVTRVTFVPTAKNLVVSASRGGTLCLWDSTSGKVCRYFQQRQGAVQGLDIYRDGCWLLSAGEDRKVSLWDISTGKETRRCTGHTDTITGVAFLPQGKRALSASLDQTVRIWDLNTGKETQRLAIQARVRCMTLSADGQRVLLGGDDGILRAWDLATGKELLRFTGHAGPILGVAFSPDGKQAVTGGTDKSVCLWQVPTGKQIHAFKGHTDRVTSVAFSPKGHYVLSGSWDRTVRLWSLPKS